MSGRMRNIRLQQLGFFFLFAICAAQVGWWVIDQHIQEGRTRDRVEHLLESQLQAAQKMRATGVSAREIGSAFPDLVFDEPTQSLAIAPHAMERLQEEAHRRNRRYAWEGGFFLVVLVTGMLVLGRALREDALLRRRQENFLASVGHEFKSPLASIRLAVETLALRDPPAAQREKLVSRMTDELNRLETLITNLLDTARMEEGAMRLHPESLSVFEVAMRLRGLFVDRAQAVSSTIEVDVPEELEVLADREAFHIALRNLIENAVAATGRNGGGRVTVTAARRDGEVRVDVTDTGDGIAEAELPRLFDKFYRPGDEMRRSGKGSGLGLYIVRTLVERSGGRVGASSEGKGKGARFSLWWPVGTVRERSA